MLERVCGCVVTEPSPFTLMSLHRASLFGAIDRTLLIW